ncbi:lysM domain receptor-like kinase 3 [Vitis riparia]|uniref:lysM domain receptor-like kinase 3 n=1 Tax=Vitis riparia TaxID=96939 RepID=UPI00155A3D40|nr:lysM domain receptor-like kinase 3 [Vitis riparia]
MALCNLLPLVFPLLLPLLADLLPTVSALESSIKPTFMYPFPCSESIKICNSSLYHINNGLQAEQIAFFYSVNRSEITYVKNQDYLVTVPCSCQKINDIDGYFYHTTYPVQQDDTFVNVSGQIYSGQAWSFGGEESKFIEGHEVDIYLPCGCVERKSQIVVTYTVQLDDTLSDIATLLSAKISGIESMNRILIQNSEYIDVGWVLFIPREKNGLSKDKEGTKHKWAIIISILAAVTVLSISTLIIIVLQRNRSQKNSEEDPKASKSLNSNRTFSFRNQHLQENIEDVPGFESERPVIFSLEEIEDATNNFDETRKIGEGGYGTVYFGVLGEQEVAIKKMRSNKSKEFFAELKVLCKIHHRNVVELLGYASGDDHLYLVYEYVQNGSLNDHLHDPLLKGNQPLSWTARTQIALDAARGIEYIHDHTKARYVHRDIKTSNILLDETLRAKVADFGLAKLVGRTNEEDFIATRLVGTPGYLPPESVKELQVTSKTDVFAFGVVLAELITGQRALVRDNHEPNKMRSLITVVNEIFHNEDPEIALEDAIDRTLRGSYTLEDVYKMAEIAEKCLSEEAVDRPKMREIVVILTQIMTSALEWEASLGGNSQVFSGLFSGR